MALKTDPAILSASTKTVLGTPVVIASRRSRGLLLATMTTCSASCRRCLRCNWPSGEVYREIPSAPWSASLLSSKKAISLCCHLPLLRRARSIARLPCHIRPPYEPTRDQLRARPPGAAQHLRVCYTLLLKGGPLKGGPLAAPPPAAYQPAGSRITRNTSRPAPP